MTEYVDIQPEPTADPDVMLFHTNVDLTLDEALEDYLTPESGDTGSPLAQALFTLPGLYALRMEGSDLRATREAGVEWHDLIEDISDVLRDFFL